MKRIGMVFLVSVLLLIAGHACLAEETPTYAPPLTKVVIMPVVNISGEKWGRLRESQTNCAYNELQSLFGERGFQQVDAKDVLKTITDQKVDLNDEEQWKRDTFYKVGEQIGADLVVYVVITDSTQRTKTSVLTVQREGNAKIKMWLLDAKNKVAIKSSKQYDAKRVSGSFGRGAKGSALQVDAVRRAIQTGLDDFLKSYPVLKAAVREDKASPRADGKWVETPAE